MWNTVEKEVVGRLGSGHTMYYEVSAGYSGNSLEPYRLSYFWKDITTGETEYGRIANTAP
jgi:hypothetical protein